GAYNPSTGSADRDRRSGGAGATSPRPPGPGGASTMTRPPGPGGGTMTRPPGALGGPVGTPGRRGEEATPGVLGTDEAPSVPEYVLVRFFDFTIKPGETYEYRVQVRMANPNYQRTRDVAYPELAKDPELKPSKPVLVAEPVLDADGKQVLGTDGKP